jgi:hypothetical protein
MRSSSRTWCKAVIQRCRDAVPEAPGALYLRPMLFGTTANIGAAATPSTEATLIVLASPVWDYFAGGMKPLRILVDDVNTRSAAQMGMVKTGGNYAAALGPTLAARAKYQVDQVLFCPGGQVQETGRREFLPDTQGRVVDPQPRFELSARRHPRFAAAHRPRLLGYAVIGAAVRCQGNARVGAHGRGGAIRNRRGACRRGHVDLQRHALGGRRRGRSADARTARAAGRCSTRRAARPSWLAGRVV